MSADDARLRRAAWRLAVQFAAVIAVIVALVGAVAYGLVAASVSESQDRALSLSGEDLRGDEAPPGTYVITVRDGRLQSSKTLPSGLPDQDALRRVAQSEGVVDSTVSADGASYAVRTRMDDDVVVQVAIDQHESQEELQRLAWSLIGAGAIGVVAAALGGYLLSRRAMQPLADALARQRRFVADASHELRTPLTLLSTRVQLLRRRIDAGAPAERIRSEADSVVADSAALTAILEDLLVAADDRRVSAVDIDLVPIAREASTAARAQAEAVGIDLTLEGPSSAIVRADESPLRRVLTSLLSNALDHARSAISIDITEGERTVVLTVADDGAGFAEGNRAFERFASDRTGEQPSAHYGLGLALVSDVVARYSGSVRIVESGPGGIVEVTLPRG